MRPGQNQKSLRVLF